MISAIIEKMNGHHINAVSIAIIEKYKISTKNFPHPYIFQACSFSKALTAFAILILVGKGKINLDTPINQLLKTWKIENGDLVTIRHCLNMTSGLIYGEPGSSIICCDQNETLPNLEDILNGTKPAKNGKIQCSDMPGENCKYSGAGFSVLQKIIEEITKTTFEIFMYNNVLLPLDMIESTFECPLRSKKNVAHGFDRHEVMIPGGFENNPYAASGGLWSTASDIAKFLLAVSDAYLGRDNRFISKSLAREMLTKQKNSYFCLGFALDVSTHSMNIRKTGHNNGYYCQLILFPNSGQGAIVMTNSANGINFIHDIISYTAEKYHWPLFSPDFDELNPYMNPSFRSKL